jgi:hypothetical protein
LPARGPSAHRKWNIMVANGSKRSL